MIVDKNYLNTELSIKYLNPEITDEYINENLIRAENNVNHLLSNNISSQEKFEALPLETQRHIKNAIGYFADYWITHNTFNEGASTSASTGSVSYSQTNTRAPDYIPPIVKNELENSGLFNRQLFLSKMKSEDCEKEFRWEQEGCDMWFFWGKHKVITWAQAEELIRNTLPENFNTSQVLPTNADLEGFNINADNADEIHQSLKQKILIIIDKTVKFDRNGQLLADPVNPLDPATKQYVDNSSGGGGGGVENTSQLTVSNPSSESVSGSASKQNIVNTQSKTEMARISAKATTNQDNITSLEQKVATNQNNIATNTENILTNTDDIEENASGVEINRLTIETVELTQNTLKAKTQFMNTSGEITKTPVNPNDPARLVDLNGGGGGSLTPSQERKLASISETGTETDYKYQVENWQAKRNENNIPIGTTVLNASETILLVGEAISQTSETYAKTGKEYAFIQSVNPLTFGDIFNPDVKIGSYKFLNRELATLMHFPLTTIDDEEITHSGRITNLDRGLTFNVEKGKVYNVYSSENNEDNLYQNWNQLQHFRTRGNSNSSMRNINLNDEGRIKANRYRNGVGRTFTPKLQSTFVSLYYNPSQPITIADGLTASFQFFEASQGTETTAMINEVKIGEIPNIVPTIDTNTNRILWPSYKFPASVFKFTLNEGKIYYWKIIFDWGTEATIQITQMQTALLEFDEFIQEATVEPTLMVVDKGALQGDDVSFSFTAYLPNGKIWKTYYDTQITNHPALTELFPENAWIDITSGGSTGISDTDELIVSNQETESLVGNAPHQNIINEQNKTEFLSQRAKLTTLQNKTQFVNQSGQLIKTPSSPNDPATKDYVDNSGGTGEVSNFNPYNIWLPQNQIQAKLLEIEASGTDPFGGLFIFRHSSTDRRLVEALWHLTKWDKTTKISVFHYIKLIKDIGTGNEGKYLTAGYERIIDGNSTDYPESAEYIRLRTQIPQEIGEIANKYYADGFNPYNIWLPQNQVYQKLLEIEETGANLMNKYFSNRTVADARLVATLWKLLSFDKTTKAMYFVAHTPSFDETFPNNTVLRGYVMTMDGNSTEYWNTLIQQKNLSVISPTENSHIATKKYVDDNSGGGSSFYPNKDITTSLLDINDDFTAIWTRLNTIENPYGKYVLWNPKGVGGSTDQVWKIISVSSFSIDVEQISLYPQTSIIDPLVKYVMKFKSDGTGFGPLETRVEIKDPTQATDIASKGYVDNSATFKPYSLWLPQNEIWDKLLELEASGTNPSGDLFIFQDSSTDPRVVRALWRLSNWDKTTKIAYFHYYVNAIQTGETDKFLTVIQERVIDGNSTSYPSGSVSKKIRVQTPTEDFEVATKKYVDDNSGGGGGLSPEDREKLDTITKNDDNTFSLKPYKAEREPVSENLLPETIPNALEVVEITRDIIALNKPNPSYSEVSWGLLGNETIYDHILPETLFHGSYRFAQTVLLDTLHLPSEIGGASEFNESGFMLSFLRSYVNVNKQQKYFLANSPTILSNLYTADRRSNAIGASLDIVSSDDFTKGVITADNYPNAVGKKFVMAGGSGGYANFIVISSSNIPNTVDITIELFSSNPDWSEETKIDTITTTVQKAGTYYNYNWNRSSQEFILTSGKQYYQKITINWEGLENTYRMGSGAEVCKFDEVVQNTAVSKPVIVNVSKGKNDSGERSFVLEATTWDGRKFSGNWDEADPDQPNDGDTFTADFWTQTYPANQKNLIQDNIPTGTITVGQFLNVMRDTLNGGKELKPDEGYDTFFELGNSSKIRALGGQKHADITISPDISANNINISARQSFSYDNTVPLFGDLPTLPANAFIRTENFGGLYDNCKFIFTNTNYTEDAVFTGNETTTFDTTNYNDFAIQMMDFQYTGTARKHELQFRVIDNIPNTIEEVMRNSTIVKSFSIQNFLSDNSVRFCTDTYKNGIISLRKNAYHFWAIRQTDKNGTTSSIQNGTATLHQITENKNSPIIEGRILTEIKFAPNSGNTQNGSLRITLNSKGENEYSSNQIDDILTLRMDVNEITRNYPISRALFNRLNTLPTHIELKSTNRYIKDPSETTNHDNKWYTMEFNSYENLSLSDRYQNIATFHKVIQPYPTNDAGTEFSDIGATVFKTPYNSGEISSPYYMKINFVSGGFQKVGSPVWIRILAKTGAIWKEVPDTRRTMHVGPGDVAYSVMGFYEKWVQEFRQGVEYIFQYKSKDASTGRPDANTENRAYLFLEELDGNKKY